MDPDTLRQPPRLEAENYWRRRVYLLAGGLAVLGIFAWSCSGSGDVRDPGRDSGQGSWQAAGGSPSPAFSRPPVPPTVTVTASPSARPRQGSDPLRAGGSCDNTDVVVNLTGVEKVYRATGQPRFTATAVNTGRGTCRFDVGRGALKVVVSSGADEVWSSADCVRGDGARIRKLARGVPYTTTIRWDRRRSSGGCRETREKALPGTYVATAKAGRTPADHKVFRLR